MRSDTRHAKIVQENGVTVYRNDIGDASITITQGDAHVVAKIDRGQLFVRYDPANAVVGFGSRSSSLGDGYPLTLSCSYPRNVCVFGSFDPGDVFIFRDMVSALADIRSNSAERTLYSAAVPQQATALTRDTLLTGRIGSCTTAFDLVTKTCATPTTPIYTDHGELYIQWGGSTYYVGGKGIFTAEVRKGDGEEDAGRKEHD